MNNKNKSFTLIELLVVIVIMGILAGVIMISTSSSIDKANIAKLKVFEESIQNSLAANMVSRWTLDEGSGTEAKDSWGSDNGTISGATWRDSNNCVSSNCLSFDGVDDYVDCGSNENLNMKDGSTMSAWVKRTSIDAVHRILHKGGQSNVALDYTFGFGASNTVFFYASKSTSSTVGVRTNQAYTTNEWLYIVGTYNGTTYRIYVNGVEMPTQGATGTNTSTSSLFIGARNDGDQHMNGYIDDVKIYDTALTLSQIKQNYVVGLNSFLSKGLISEGDYNERILSLSLN